MFGRSNPATITLGRVMLELFEHLVGPGAASAVAVSASRGTPGKRIEQQAELAVVGAEIVAPFGHAVRLVDREQRNRQSVSSSSNSGCSNRSGAR